MFEFLYYVLYIVFGFEFVIALSNVKYPRKKIRLYMLPLVILCILAALYLFLIPDRHYFNFFFPMIAVNVGFGFSMAISKDDGFRGLFPFLSALFFITISDTLGNAVYVYAMHTWNDWKVIVPEIIFMSTVLFCIRKFIKPFYDMTSINDKRSWMSLDLVLVSYECMSFMMSVTMSFEEIVMIRLGLEFITMIVFINASVLSGRTAKEQALEYEKKLLDDQIKAGLVQINTFNEKEKQLAEIRHDVYARLETVKELNTGDNCEKINEILEDIKVELNRTKSFTYSSNMHVNSVISVFKNQAEAESVEFDAMIDMRDDLEIDTVDFSVLLTNLLQNALAGCGTVPDDERKFIYVQGRTSRNSFILEMTCSDTGDGPNLYYVDLFTKKYGGIYDCVAGDGNVTIKMLINL